MKLDSSAPLETPVLFLVFNRPDKTERVFAMIRSVRPRKLYVACDCPREGRVDDVENVQKVKHIVERVDWPCETHYLYHPKNRGCALAGKMAWDWFFSQEEEMIFLEDDGLVTRSFFYFCQELLKKYKNDSQVAYVSGINRGLKSGTATYFFTRMSPSTYAMATWKRVYDLYEYKLNDFYGELAAGNVRKWYKRYWIYRVYRDLFCNYVDYGGETYDVQMCYLVGKHGMLSVVPNYNMVSNIGFDDTGTHPQTNPDTQILDMICHQPMCELEEIVDPLDKTIDEAFEKEYSKVRMLHGVSPLRYCVRSVVRQCAREVRRLF